MKYNEIAKRIIFSSKYLSLSTCDEKKPWSAPLYFGVDKKFNFYFISRKDTRHSKHIYKNNLVSFSIFGAKDKKVLSQGLQASGIALETKGKEIITGIKAIYKKKYPVWKEFLKHRLRIKDVTGAINCRVYKITPIEIFILDPKNPEMDTRKKVNLNH